MQADFRRQALFSRHDSGMRDIDEEDPWREVKLSKTGELHQAGRQCACMVNGRIGHGHHGHH